MLATDASEWVAPLNTMSVMRESGKLYKCDWIKVTVKAYGT